MGKKVTNIDFISRCKEKHGDEYDYSITQYVSMAAPILYVCPKHGIIEQNAHDHVQGHGCPKCQMSKLEASVEKKMIEENIDFERQKKFPWLSGMSLDFYISFKDIAIECQGEQHYFDKEFFNKREGLNERVERDARKRQLCKENGIELIYFLEPKFEKYEMSGNLYFTDIDKLVEYIKSKR